MKTKIAVVGTGGVGGLIGGLLAKYYAGSESVEIYFISRGEALKRIRTAGLMVDAQTGRFIAHPVLATDSTEQIGTMDYILLCTKSYDVEQAIEQMEPAIASSTVILPFLNGVDSVERIKAKRPDVTLWEGCVYVVAYIVEPGHIAEATNGYRYYFGSAAGDDPRLSGFETLCTDAGIRIRHVEDIMRRVWDKFAFISPVATATSYFDQTYGVVLGDPQRRGQFVALQQEFQAVADAKGIKLSEDVAQQVIDQMERIPPDTTTSMQRDFRAGRPTELESLTGYIVRVGESLGVPVPTYRKMYDHLKGKV